MNYSETFISFLLFYLFNLMGNFLQEFAFVIIVWIYWNPNCPIIFALFYNVPFATVSKKIKNELPVLKQINHKQIFCMQIVATNKFFFIILLLNYEEQTSISTLFNFIIEKTKILFYFRNISLNSSTFHLINFLGANFMVTTKLYSKTWILKFK